MDEEELKKRENNNLFMNFPAKNKQRNCNNLFGQPK